MTNKQKILQILYLKRGTCISGSEMASELGITRSAVGKIINEIKAEGYKVESIHHKGYMLSGDSDIISKDIIENKLNSFGISKKIEYLDTVDSTNAYAKKLVMSDDNSIQVVVANKQTVGRGRMGRGFYSPSDTGIYCSFILKPQMSIQASLMITVAASVAVSRAIESVTGKQTGIKWINDIFIGKKKISGILTEAVTGFETGLIENIILGIGINFIAPQEGFPEEISQIAGAIFDESETKNCTRNDIIAKLIFEIDKCLFDIENPEIINFYKEKSIVIGRHVRIIYPGKNPENGVVRDIDNNGFLIVDTEDGVKVLNSGEISIRF